MSDSMSGVGVVDKVVAVLSALAPAPLTLAGLTETTGLPRATAHRLAAALAVHGLVARTPDGAFRLGPRVIELAGQVASSRPDLARIATPLLQRLSDVTGESAQLYVRSGDSRICIAAVERPAGLRDSVPVGAVLPMTAGSGAQALLALEPPADVRRLVATAAFDAATLNGVRRRGWAESVGEREPGVASVSAPVRGPGRQVVAAVSVSGPIERIGRAPGRRLGRLVRATARDLEVVLQRAE